jgi:hypothetical protein
LDPAAVDHLKPSGAIERVQLASRPELSGLQARVDALAKDLGCQLGDLGER